MKKLSVSFLSLMLMVSPIIAQTQGGQPQQQTAPDDVVRISTALVQTDVVVTDKNDQIVPDLKLDDFEVYENGKKQDVKFMEFVSVDTGSRAEGARPTSLPAGVNAEVAKEMTARDLKRVVAFVVDDLTIAPQDLYYIRQALTDFVDNKMQEGDLVAIVRTVGGKGLLQQFTSDRQLLRRAIAQLNIVTNPLMTYNNPADAPLPRTAALPSSEGGGDTGGASDDVGGDSGVDIGGAEDDTKRLFRGLISLQTTNYVVDSLKQIPGRKSLVLISGGIPIFETNSSGSAYSSISYFLQQLVDNAIRAGVVINTLDPRGLRATPGVASFIDTPGRSALTGGPDPNFIQGGTALGLPLAGGEEHIGLNTLSSATGGVTIANTNNLKTGLEKVMNRSRGYYLLAYTPEDKFDNKFRKLQVKVKRPGLKVYNHSGYIAREDRGANAPKSKEEAILEAAKSPLARRDVDVSPNIAYKLTAADKAAVDINLRIDAKNLNFTSSADGKQQASFDVVGFVYDQFGKLRGGFSETVNANLTPQDYQRALREGLTYTASTELPSGYFQLRAVVREASTGHMGTISRYLEIPNLSNGKLAMSTLYLFAADPSKTSTAQPVPLTAVRTLSRKQDLRYAAVIYNAKRDNNKPQVRTQLIISQGANILFKEPEQTVNATDPSKILKVGQVGLSGVKPGRYVMTLVVTDPLADKKSGTVSRSIDFTVVE